MENITHRSLLLRFILLSTLILSTTFICAQTEKRIYLLDTSGSMRGFGVPHTSNVFKQAKADLLAAIEKLNDSTEITVIPFGRVVSPVIEGDKDKIIKLINQTVSSKGNTNVLKAWELALSRMNPNKTNLVFLISDGLHNCGATEKQVADKLNDWPIANASNSNIAYFYVVSPASEQTNIAKIFDAKDKMEVIHSLDVNIATKSQNVKGQKPIAKKTFSIVKKKVLTSTSSSETSAWSWLWILIIIIAIVLIYLFIKFVVPNMLANGKLIPVFSTKFSNQSLYARDAHEDSIDSQYKQNLRERGWPDPVINNLRTKEEAEIYKRANLEPKEIDGKFCLAQPGIDCTRKDEFGRTNLERMKLGLAPLDNEGVAYELHHVGQHPDSPLAELTQAEHRIGDNDKILHDKTHESEIDRNSFSKERISHWRSRAKQVKLENK